MPGLSTGGRRLWCKREDRAGALYGGNKVRKLEWLLPAALADGRRAVLTAGAVGSNHALATCLYGAAAGLKTHLVLLPQPDSPHARENAARLGALAHGLWPAHTAPGAALQVGRAWVAAWREDGRAPQGIWVGGSDPLGVVGWVEGGLEIAAQVREGQLPEPSDLFVPLGSGGTAAGLLLGLQLGGLATRVRAVRVAAAPLARSMTLALARAAARQLRRAGAGLPPLDPSRLMVDDSAIGPGYGAPTEDGAAAAERGRAAGLYMEPVYTARCLAACLRAVDAGEVGPEVMYLHTISGAAPPLNAALPAALSPLLR